MKHEKAWADFRRHLHGPTLLSPAFHFSWAFLPGRRKVDFLSAPILPQFSRTPSLLAFTLTNHFLLSSGLLLAWQQCDHDQHPNC